MKWLLSVGLFLAVLTVVAAFFVGRWAGKAEAKAELQSTGQMSEHAGGSGSAALWTCPMHPEVVARRSR